MAEDDQDDVPEDTTGDTPEEDQGDGKSQAKKKGGKLKLIIIIVVGLLVVLGAAGGGLFYFGLLDTLLGIEYEEKSMEQADEPINLGTPIYYNIPEFVADLKVDDCRAPYLKLSLTLQIDQADQPVVVERQPKIIDRILKYLREQKRRDLVGEAGAENLRTEITLIIDATIKPAKVQNVLFKSLVLQ